MASRNEPQDLTDQKWLETDQFFAKENVVNITDEGEHLELSKYGEDFESYDTGNLNGQGNWSGSTDFQVQTTTKYSGSQAVSCNTAADAEIETTTPDITSGVISCYMRVGSTGTSTYSAFVLREGTTPIAFFDFSSSQSIRYGSGTSVVLYLNPFTEDQWYHLQIEIDPSTNKIRYRVDTGSWTSWGDAWQSASFTKIDLIYLRELDSFNMFCDDIVTEAHNEDGYRVSNPLSLDAIKKVESSNIKWTDTKPTNTDLKIYTAVSTSNTVEPATIDYSEEVSDTAIDGIAVDDNLTGKYLWVRQELSTTDTGATPRLSSLEVDVSGEGVLGTGFFSFM